MEGKGPSTFETTEKFDHSCNISGIYSYKIKIFKIRLSTYSIPSDCVSHRKYRLVGNYDHLVMLAPFLVQYNDFLMVLVTMATRN